MSEMPKELEQMRDSINGFDYVDDNDFAETIHCAMIETFDRCYEAMSTQGMYKTIENKWRERQRELKASMVPMADVQILVEAIRETLGAFNLFGNSHEPKAKWPKHILKCEKALSAFAARTRGEGK